jgi:adenine-specific DNA-methyltransferase
MKFKAVLLELLKTDNRLLDAEGELMGNKIQDLADKTDEKLIELLLDNSETRMKFFLKIKDVFVFKTSDFKFYLDENKIDNSYTQYENRIGLTSKGKFLKDSNDIVLDFPYKDCVLEGGQSTEEGTDTYFEWDEKDQHYTEKQAKRKEIFFNNVLAKDEIDRLLEPKAFTNVKKYSLEGVENLAKFERNENGTIKDNLIIKGNNLLALHTLKKEFAGKVKLIYIDPPYNTGDDEFSYNDNFNHSTWLTFMYNRLNAAKDLLLETGVITVQINDIEYSYLQIILNEVFGKENFISSICVKMAHLSGTKMAHKERKIPKIKELILIYAKNKDRFRINPYYIPVHWNEAFSRYKSFILKNKDDINNHKLWKVEPLGKHLNDKGLSYNNSSETVKYLIENSENIFRTAINRSFDYSSYNPEEFNLIQRGKNKVYIYKGEDVNFASYKMNIIEGKLQPTSVIGDIWSDIGINNLSNEGGVSLRFGKKPEKLIERVISLFTNSHEIVLDYHLGSGTTAAVAHKMDRQYIGIEQLNYGKNDSLERLKKVIDGEQGGISKSVNWQGGGSFVYLELAKNNQNAIEQIQHCKSYEELTSFFDEMCEKYFLHYNVKVKQFREVISKEENFKKLSLDNQKELFIKMLDLNQLYVNVSDMEDKKYNLSADDIAITKDFYQL